MLKSFCIVITLLIAHSSSYADCSSNGIYFWPQTPTIKQNSIIVIEGYAMSQKIISELNTTYPIYLKSEKNKIKLNVLEICVGQFQLTQAILVPEENLTAGLEYEIVIENLTEGDVLKQWNVVSGKYELIKWTLEEGIDNTKPTWTKKPNEEKKSYIPYGCGPGKNVQFNFAIYDESPVMLKTKVTHINSGKSATYYLDVNIATQVNIGHGMCSGAFTFKDGEAYEISFDIVDFSGNLTAWTYDNIMFTAPFISDGEGN